MTWREYEEVISERAVELHREIHTGAYRARPSRRVLIPKSDGKQRALGIACLEDKIVQQAVTTVLSAIYEQDFLGFSYGWRQGRSQHDALDALTVGIKSQDVNWILDADIAAFFDEIDHDWDAEVSGASYCGSANAWSDPQMAQSGGDGGWAQGCFVAGNTPRRGGVAATGEHLPALRSRSMDEAMASKASTGKCDCCALR